MGKGKWRERFGRRRTSSGALSYQVEPFGYDSATELLSEARLKDTSTQRNIIQFNTIIVRFLTLSSMRNAWSFWRR